MCGLVGIIGANIITSELDRFTQMFLVNVTRGVDGCGLIKTYNRTDGFYYAHDKTETPSSEYVLYKDYEDFIKTPRLTALMGHSRAATIGKVEEKNNHPFKTKSLLGMHNGTIRGKFELSDQYDTDSEALFNLIEKDGLKEALGKIYKATSAPAYALTYYNHMDHSITIIRNQARTLYLTHQNGVFYYASEKRFLQFALKNSAIDIEEVPTHTRLYFDLKKGQIKPVIEKDFIKPEDHYRTFPAYSYWGRSDNHKKTSILVYDHVSGRMVTKQELEDLNKTREKARKKFVRDNTSKQQSGSNIADPSFSTMYSVPFHGSYSYISEHMLLKQINKTGCSICSSEIEDPTTVRFTKGNEPVCVDCKDKITSYGEEWDNMIVPKKLD